MMMPFFLMVGNLFSIYFIYLITWFSQVLFLVVYNKLSPIGAEAFLSLIFFIFPTLLVFKIFDAPIDLGLKKLEFNFKAPAIFIIIINIYTFYLLFTSLDADSIFQYYYLARLSDKNSEIGVYSNPVLAQIPALSFAYTVVWSYFISRIDGWKLYIIYILLILTSLLLMTALGARSGAFYFLLIVFTVLALRKIFSKKELFGYFFLIVIIFIATTFFMRTDGFEEQGGILPRLLNDLVVYFFSGIPAYSIFYEGRNPVIDFDFNSIVNMYQPEQMDFFQVADGLYTNVYTAFASYLYFFDSFGYVIYFLFNFISIIFILQFRNFFVSKFFLPFFVVSLMLSPFQNYLFTFIPYYERILIILFVIIFFERLRLK